MAEKFPIRILVVDDEPLIRWSIAETLKAHGHEVIEADCGHAAVRVLKGSSLSLDAVVLDYRLPDTDDLSLLVRLRRMAPHVPVILMTAFGTPELASDALRLGACAVMNKPFRMEELEAAVSRACAGSAMRVRRAQVVGPGRP